MIDGFEFVHDSRTFVCTVEASTITPKESWWWFRASSDDRHKYAPFRAASGDTRASVRTRVVAYYEDLLFRRSQPAQSWWRRGAPQKTPAQVAAAAAAAAAAAGAAAAQASAAPVAVTARK